MTDDEKFMQRCLQLALNGKGYTKSNPLVGAVVVCRGKIIGEGFHQQYGKAHAEVNAINNVKDKSLLKESTLYVSLEPCSHYGKTPPCSKLIIDCQIPSVIVATLDPYPEVSGKGVKMLSEAGIKVITGVLQDEAQYLNRDFFTAQIQKRPYIYLKWAETRDGFLDRKRTEGQLVCPTPISNPLTKVLVHKLRSEVSAIMVATNTAINDNPSLTTRYWYGNNPIRIILDRQRRIPSHYQLFSDDVETFIFTEEVEREECGKNTHFIPLNFDSEMFISLFKILNDKKITSVLVEGGSSLLNSFICAGVWDEAYVEVADCLFKDGIKAPQIGGVLISERKIGESYTRHLMNTKNLKYDKY